MDKNDLNTEKNPEDSLVDLSWLSDDLSEKLESLTKDLDDISNSFTDLDNAEVKQERPVKKEAVNNENIKLVPVDEKRTKRPKTKGFDSIKVPTFNGFEPNNNGSNNNNNNGPKKKKKRKKKKDTKPTKTFVWAMVMCCVVFLCICGVGACTWFAAKLCQGMPEFSAADLESMDSSIIYDSEGNQVIELGMYLRENIEYEDLPNCVIDAFLAIEDSRYFEHIGFDIPRFTKAILVNIKSGSFGQGGSTLTMQLVKNSYFQTESTDSETMAARSGMSGVKRKMQEIVLAIEANRKLSKQEIFALALNKFNFGQNIRGIQKASEYYFGKDVTDLSLNEAAFLAGIINGPNSYNIYNELSKGGKSSYVSDDISYIDNANDKKNQVLYQMVYHGYITQEEYELNKNIRLENLVVGVDEKFGNTNTYYQSYIDAVITEVEEVTGKSPYTTAMNIYTSMDAHMQEYVYDMQNNPEKFNKYVFRHDDQQNALVVMNNQTGELIALGGGRDQEDSARQFNRAVDSYINPGSTIKPVLEYALAFETLGYATSHTICDQPVYMYETDIAVSNAYGQGYTGDMHITEALARSLNTPAIQLMQELFDYYEDLENPEQPIIEYCQSIGFDWCDEDTFDIQWAIGGRDCLVSPVQLAGAHGMIINGGMYIKPHCIQRIEYRGKYNETPDYVADTTGTRVLSEASAYMVSYCLNYNVTSGWIGQLSLLKRDYPTFAKTGTTNFASSAYEYYDIPESAAKDQWLCTQTSNYTIVVWNGFDQLEDGAYFTVEDETYNLKCKMGSMLLDELMDHFNYEATSLERPDSVIEIEHINGCFPYAKGTGAKGLISKDSPYAELVDEASIVKENKGGKFYHTGIVDQGDGVVAIHWDEFNSYLEDGRVDTSATSVSGETTVIASGRSYYQRYNYILPDMFYAVITTGDGQEISVESPLPTTTVETGAIGPYKVCGWTSADMSPKCSMQVGYEDPEEESD